MTIRKRVEHILRRAQLSREAIDAVHDNDLETLLLRLGLLHDVHSGRSKCKFCRSVVTLDSLQALFPDSGSVAIVCDKPECVKRMMTYLEERR